MKKTLFSLLIILFPSVTLAAECIDNPADASDDSAYLRCRLVDYMDTKVNYVFCNQRIKPDNDDDLCIEGIGDGSQEWANYADGFYYDEGEFGNNNTRYQEAVYSLALLYQEPLSKFYKEGDYGSQVLKRILWALDYLRRVQRDDRSEVSWFTCYAMAQAINLVGDEAAFQEALEENIRNDEGNLVERKQAYGYLLAHGAYYMTHGGRGHAANQDVEALLALYALHEAYDLIGYAVPDEEEHLDDLMRQLDDPAGEFSLNSLRDEIFFGSPQQAIDGGYPDECAGDYAGGNGFDRWFTEEAYLLEKGYRAISVCERDTHSVGYDGNYGWVALRGMGELLQENYAPELVDFVENYIDWFQYFFYVDLNDKKGGYQVSAIARRTWQDGRMNLGVSGLLQEIHPAMRILFNASLEHFAADPDSFFSIESTDFFGGAFYVIGELIKYWKTPVSSDYLLPLNDPSFESLIIQEEDQFNIPITLLEITKEDDGKIHFLANDWWNGQKTYTYGDDYATITFSENPDTPCDLTDVDDGEYCYGDDGDLKEKFKSCEGCPDGGDVILEVYVTVPEAKDVNLNVDRDGNGDGNYFDADDDNDAMPDTWEAAYGLNSFDASDANGDLDGDGLTNLEEYNNGTNPQVVDNPALLDTDGDGLTDTNEAVLGTNPNDTDSDDDGLSDGQEVNTYRTDPLDNDTDNDNLTDYQEVINGQDPLVYTDYLSPIFSIIMSGDDDNDGYDSIDDGGTDCDDANAAIYEGAAEICGDGIDNNCDGIIDPDCDDDGDGYTNSFEWTLGTNPTDSDSDDDALSDYEEGETYHTDPLDSDTDGDRLNDGAEVNRYGTNPNSRDSDGDRLTDNQEVKIYNTDPLDADTDDDGWTDYREVKFGRDPLDPGA